MATTMATPPATDKTIRIARFFSYPKTLVYVLIGLLGLVSLIHFLRLVLRLTFREPVPRPDGIRSRRPLLRRWPLAAIDWLRAKSMRKTLRLLWGAQVNWLEGAVTVGYVTLLLAFLFSGTTTLEGQRVEPHYYANRAGTIAATQFPIMTALGMRNNPFSCTSCSLFIFMSLLTVIFVSFLRLPLQRRLVLDITTTHLLTTNDRPEWGLNYLHRMTARVLVILVWIHAGGRLTVGLLDDETINHPWVRSGFLAASTLTLLALVTFRPVRQKAYEWFMVIHFVGAGIFLLALLKHLSGRSLTAYGAWPSLLLWGVDRSLRGLQYLFYNHPYFTPGSANSSRRACDAEVEVLRVRKRATRAGTTQRAVNKEDDDDEEDEPRFLRITLQRPRFRWRPGQSAFLAFPSVGVPGVFASSAPPPKPSTPTVDSSSSPEAGPSARASDASGDAAYRPSTYTPSTNPLRTHPFQSHPFTIMSHDDVSPYHEAWGPSWGVRWSSLFSCFSRKRSNTETRTDTSDGGSDQGSAEKGEGTPEPDPKDLYGFNGALGPRGGARPRPLVFVVRVREGMTRALWDRAAASGRAIAPADTNVDVEKGRRRQTDDDGESASDSERTDGVDYGGTGLKCTVPAFISGPYSNPPVLVGYHTVMLIAGGTGVAFTLPLFLDVIERVKRGEPSCSQLVFIWAVRDIDHLEWIEDEVLQAVSTVPEGTPISVRYLFCITGRDEDTATTVLPAPAPNPEADAAAEAMNNQQRQEEQDDPWRHAVFTPTPKQQKQFARDAKRRAAQERLIAAGGVPSAYVPSNASQVQSSWNSGKPLGKHKPPPGTPLVTSMLQLPGVRLVKTKPPIRTLMQFELAQCQGRLSVNVCGTPSLANSVREVLSQERMDDVMSFGPTVTLHVEAFGG
ncbi:hypothetical protein D9619_008266 [Psilocybe cf. subviscida]|uniref:FAD-binding FR-type domain-containing protein n=1 Tax=Psilocybe cf. subviscida TaxID=2480587 RepID=A0A8H5ATI1_9AGAR|nr:hypothetical protein D9619_008266 [Psilocybe cf. subviscida]